MTTDKVIANLEQVSAKWLTTVLAQSGALTRGAVQSFEFGTGQGNWSTSANLKVTYAADAQGALPKRLFLKMVDTDTGDGEFFTDGDVTYYTRDYGVSNYGWNQLYDDYKSCVAMCVYIATEYCRGGINEKWAHVWLPMLQRALTACDDLVQYFINVFRVKV